MKGAARDSGGGGELGVWGGAAVQTECEPHSDTLSFNCPHFSDLITAQFSTAWDPRIRLPETGKEKGIERARQRLEHSGHVEKRVERTGRKGWISKGCWEDVGGFT